MGFSMLIENDAKRKCSLNTLEHESKKYIVNNKVNGTNLLRKM